MDMTKSEDLKSVMEIFHQAQVALKSMNVDQWQNGYPSQKIIKADIKNNISHVVTLDNIIVATAAIFIGHEPTYDNLYNGVWITSNEPYCVIHRIAVKEEYKGQNIGAFIVDHAVLLSKNNAASSIRVDTHRDNLPMQRMLQKNGFSYCGIIYLKDKSERFAYEKPL